MIKQYAFQEKHRIPALIIAVLFFILISLGFLYGMRTQVRHYIHDDIDKQLLIVAESLQLIIAEDYHLRAKTADAISPAEYQGIESKLTALAEKSGAKYIWTDILLDGKVYLTSCNKTSGPDLPQAEIYYFMPYDQGVSEAELQAFAGTTPVYATFEDIWGHFRAVFIPVTLPDGSKYLACAEFTLDHVAAVVRKSNLFFLAGLGAFVIGISPLLFLYITGARNARKLLEDKNAQLQLSRENLETTLNSIGDGVITTDSQGLIRGMNPVAEKLCGWKDSDAAGKPLSTVLNLVSNSDQETGIDPVDRVLASKRTVTIDRDICLLSRDRKRIELTCSAAPILKQDTEAIIGVVLVIRDVTEQRRIEEQLNAGRKMEAIGVLASGIAHDFNNMLGGIIGATEVLGFYLPEDAKVQKMRRTILDSANRAAELTRQLLSFSHRAAKVSTSVNLHSLIDETVSLLEKSIDRRIRILTDLEAEQCHILGDSAVLHNCLLNLCINAAHAMPEGGELRISTTDIDIDQYDCDTSQFDLNPGRFIEINVRDTGCGIPTEHLERIFEPFFTTKNPGKGTGLGLSSAYGAVKRHNGAISVYSEVGKGTVFRLLLPLTERESSVVDKIRIITGTGCILLVDDEEIMQITASNILEKLGYEVILASNGQEAVDIFHREKDRIDLVITDMVMPVMNGRDCFNSIRDIDPAACVILTSGFSHDEDLRTMKNAGLDGFIRKPYFIAPFSQIIYDTLRKKRNGLHNQG